MEPTCQLLSMLLDACKSASEMVNVARKHSQTCPICQKAERKAA